MYVSFLWRNMVMPCIYVVLRIIEKFCLRNFTKYHAKKLKHHGHSFDLFLSPNNGFLDKFIYLYGVYEPYILDLIAKYLKPGDTFIDIGANIGQHSLFAACLVGKTGKVYSFEPIPNIHQQFLDSIKINNFQNIIHSYNNALGNSNETKKFYVKPKNIGASSLVNLDDSEKIIQVSVKIGDEMLGNVTRIDMIKIDVEGYEYEVLLGIKNSLKKYLPILILEFSGTFYLEQGQDHGSKILLLLQDLGYTIYDIEDNLRLVDKKSFLESFTQTGILGSLIIQTNLLCLKK